MTEIKRIMIYGTNGPDNPEKATLPFIIANAGFVHDAEVIVMLAGPGVWLAKKGVAEHVLCCKWGLKELMDKFFEMGGKLLLCSPCLEERGLKKEDMIEEAEITGAVDALAIAAEADVVLTF